MESIQAHRNAGKAIKMGKPKSIQTDAAGFYPRAFRKVFYRLTALKRQQRLAIQHKVQNYSKTGIHNYKIETVFMKIKDRVHDFRGLKALWSAPILMMGLVLQHNFIEPHTTIKKAPCELAGEEMTFGDNRWLSLIRMASA